MSLADTALKERAETAGGGKLPTPGEYTVESTGSPQVPLDSIITITVEDFKGWFTLDGETLGETTPLLNGDFKVSYESGGSSVILQFRQTGVNAEYIFGVSVASVVSTGMPMDDPPITGVWGAEARPPREEPYPSE